MDFEREYREARDLAESGLQSAFADGVDGPHRELLEAMEYSLLAGGKRVRPVRPCAGTWSLPWTTPAVWRCSTPIP